MTALCFWSNAFSKRTPHALDTPSCLLICILYSAAMPISTVFSQKERTLSFEFFPPKTDTGQVLLDNTISQLAHLGADFVSVTYGAGGSTREKTRDIVLSIQKKYGLKAMAHLTCVNASQAEIAELLDDYAEQGIANILALRGDPPAGEERFTPTDGGYAYASELLTAIKADQRFTTVCAAYPDGHPEAKSVEADWDQLIHKFNCGASAAITQCIFEVGPWKRMCEYVGASLDNPRIIPGILPVTDYHAVERFCNRCGAAVPEVMRTRLAHLADDPVAVRKEGMAFTIEMCAELLQAGAPGLHIYSLNKTTATAELVTALRLLGHLE